MLNYYKYIFIITLTVFCIKISIAAETIFQKESFEIQKKIEIYNTNQKKINFYNSLDSDKNYIINFWATWCLPCKKELPELQKMQNDYKNLNIIIISIDRKEIKKQLKFLKKNSVKDLKKYFDTKMQLFKSLNLRGIPTTILLKKKTVVAKREGIFKYDKKSFKEIISFFN